MENHHVLWVNPLFLWQFSIAFCIFTRGYSDQNPPGWLKMGPAFRVEDFKASNTSFSLARCTSAIRGQDLRLKKLESNVKFDE